MGIGSTNPLVNLHILGTEGILMQSEHGVGNPQSFGNGTRMHFYPYKSAFRAGHAIGDFWDDVNIGEYSSAMGLGTKASGFASVAFGEDCYATGWASSAFGVNTSATGWGSTTLGIMSSASAYGSVSIGFSTKAESYSSIALGMNNVGGGTPDSWDPDDPLFEIGNGYGGTPSNAVTVLKNGNVGIGMIAAPSVKLSLGANIAPKKLALFDGLSDFYGFGVDWGRITIYTNNTEKMTIKDNGNVGINVTKSSGKIGY